IALHESRCELRVDFFPLQILFSLSSEAWLRELSQRTLLVRARKRSLDGVSWRSTSRSKNASLGGLTMANKWDERKKAQEDEYFVEKERELLAQLKAEGGSEAQESVQNRCQMQG